MGVVCCSLMYVPRWVWHVHVAHTQRGGKKTKKLKVLVCGLRIMASGKKWTFDEVEVSEMVVSPSTVVHVGVSYRAILLCLILNWLLVAH